MHAVSTLLNNATSIACAVVQCPADGGTADQEPACSRLSGLLHQIANAPWFEDVIGRIDQRYPGFIEHDQNGDAVLSTLGNALRMAASVGDRGGMPMQGRAPSMIDAGLSDLQVGIAAMEYLPAAGPLHRSDLAVTAARILARHTPDTVSWDVKNEAANFLAALGRISAHDRHPRPVV